MHHARHECKAGAILGRGSPADAVFAWARAQLPRNAPDALLGLQKAWSRSKGSRVKD